LANLCVGFHRIHAFDTGSRKLFDGIHQTNGIDVYVTGERTILLDSQVLAVVRRIFLHSLHCFTDVLGEQVLNTLRISLQAVHAGLGQRSWAHVVSQLSVLLIVNTTGYHGY